jgi:hypothetical protein
LAALGTHEFVTASFMGWGHLRNGTLLRAAEEAGFEIFLTRDRTLVYEQNLAALKITVLSLSANNWPIVKDYVDKIHAAVDSAVLGSRAEIDTGEFRRRKAGTGSAGSGTLPGEPNTTPD